MCNGCWVDKGLATKFVEQELVLPETVALIEAIRSVHTPPYGEPYWHGGPAHAELDDWNIELDVAVSLDDLCRPMEESSHHQDIAPRYRADMAMWFLPGSPWHVFAERWNAAPTMRRAVALAEYEGYIKGARATI